MAQYIVSARKYRPTKFKDMVGQEHVSATLQNAIKTEQLAHSFLFCGPRGVGKTTAARILAKTINCENITPDIEACDQCQSCVSFNQNSSFNIHELDAASNNSVDDIRQLVDQVRFPPQSGKYKIYIIDEVHMLSAGAFNAFLKTLEEPPAYCKFILATTEKHKILPTILSRCQIFDFRRIAIDVIVKHLKGICELENIEAEEDALHIIAQKCDGGMRDALSMFDRLSSFAGGKLTYAGVLENLNVLDYDYFFKVTDALLSTDMPALMNYFSEILKKGFEGDDFVLGLCEHFRNLLFSKNTDTLALMEVSDNLKRRYFEQSSLSNASFLINCLSIGNQADVQYKASKNKRLLVELTLLKMCYVNATIEASEDASKKKVVEGEKVEVREQRAENKNEKIEIEVPKNIVQATASPTSVKPRVISDKDSGLKKSSKILSFDDLDAPENIVSDAVSKDNTKEEMVVVNDTLLEWNDLQVKLLWQTFADTIRESKRGFANLMELYVPVVKERMLEIHCESDLQKSQFDQHAASIRNFYYQNTGVAPVIELFITKTATNSNPKLYTPQDKLKRLIELNPNIRKFQKDLGLDIDYN